MVKCRGVYAICECGDGSIEFLFEMNRLPLVRCLAGCDTCEVSNNRGHSTPVLDDVPGIGFGAVEVGFFSDGFSESENAKEWIVQLMSNSGGQSSQTARFLGLDELVLESALVSRVSEDQADPILSLISPCHVEPLIVISTGSNLNLLSGAWIRHADLWSQRVARSVD